MTDSFTRELVRDAYILSDPRFQTMDLLVNAFGLEAVTELVRELGGMRLRKSEAMYPGYLSLGPVMKRALGESWTTAFDAVGADVITLPTLRESVEMERDVVSYCRVTMPTHSRPPKASDRDRAKRVRLFLREAGLEL